MRFSRKRPFFKHIFNVSITLIKTYIYVSKLISKSKPQFLFLLPFFRQFFWYKNYRKGEIILIGYARISTTDQNFNLQTDTLTKASCDKIFWDVAPAVRNSLDEALNSLRGRWWYVNCMEARPTGTVISVALGAYSNDPFHTVRSEDLTQPERNISFRYSI